MVRSSKVLGSGRLIFLLGRASLMTPRKLESGLGGQIDADLKRKMSENR